MGRIPPARQPGDQFRTPAVCEQCGDVVPPAAMVRALVCRRGRRRVLVACDLSHLQQLIDRHDETRVNPQRPS